jgi:hypothetical protein
VIPDSLLRKSLFCHRAPPLAYFSPAPPRISEARWHARSIRAGSSAYSFSAIRTNAISGRRRISIWQNIQPPKDWMLSIPLVRRIYCRRLSARSASLIVSQRGESDPISETQVTRRTRGRNSRT